MIVLPLDGFAVNWLERDSLSGSWGGLRDTLKEQGVTIDLAYSGEMVRHFSGGTFNRSGSVYHDNLDLMLSVDSEKLGLWQGGTLFVYGLRNHGGDPTANLIGDLQTASNIEAPDQFIVYEAWYEQQWLDGGLSILAGLHNMNSEFYVSEYGSLFLNSSFGIGPEVAGNVTASLFPRAALGARARIRPSASVYLQAAVYDGDPATRSLSAREGHMVIAEAGVTRDDASYKIGSWLHTADRFFAGRLYANDYGAYGVVDQPLFVFDGGARLGLFAHVGWVPAGRNAITRYAGGGVHLQALIPGRDEDLLGLAVARADTHLDAETTFELTYRLVLTPWLFLQPSLQWIDNPGGDATVRSARVGLLRFTLQL